MPNNLFFRLLRPILVNSWNPFRWLLLQLFFRRLPQIKARSLAKESPFLKIPKEKWINESENAFVVKDIAPRTPVHLLVIPKQRIPSMLEASPALLGELLQLAKETAQQVGIAEKGFRIVINTNPHGVQTVYHLHIHIMGGRQLSVPLK